MLEEKIFFENPQTANEIFAGDILHNKKIIELSFDVKFLIRENCIFLSSNSKEKTKSAATFIKELFQVHESGYVIHQKDFELILAAARKDSKCKIKELYKESIKVSPRKNPVVPRTLAQYQYIREMKNNDIIFGVGPAGTGKTYLAMAMAISLFLEGKYDRIILTRPAMEAGENLGFLPGSLEEKIKPYLRPLYDALYEMLEFDEANKLIEQNIVEVAPLAFMRGRTLNNSFIILDEAQNTTIEQMMMFLTRFGFESKCIVTGDPSQTDLPGNKKSGLVHSIRVLRNIKDISFLEFTSNDVVRNSLVAKIINAYGNDKKVLQPNY